jgi:hypothetical protein
MANDEHPSNKTKRDNTTDRIMSWLRRFSLIAVFLGGVALAPNFKFQGTNRLPFRAFGTYHSTANCMPTQNAKRKQNTNDD